MTLADKLREVREHLNRLIHAPTHHAGDWPRVVAKEALAALPDPDEVAKLEDALEHARGLLDSSQISHVGRIRELEQQRDELAARLHYDCEGCPGCGSGDCPDALDVALFERDELAATLRDMKMRVWLHHGARSKR